MTDPAAYYWGYGKGPLQPQGYKRAATHQMLELLASSIMPRTTLDLDASVLEQLRRRAASERKSMGQVASERLAVGLEKSAPKELSRLRWPSRRMGKPEVDLEDKDALWKALDEQRPEPHTR
jgi:hypothetical protein